MEHQKDNNSSSMDDEMMLPGFRFHPTDEELVSFYLKRKVHQRPLSIELIKQLDIYKYDPWDLPKMATIGEKEWYFYCPRDRKYRNSARPNRVTSAGFWKATGTDRPIYNSDGTKCIGLKKSLVFYTGRAAKGVKTDWMMHEFRLPPTVDSKASLDKNLPPNDSWAICRIFKKNTATQRAIPHSWTSSTVLERRLDTSSDNYNIVVESNTLNNASSIKTDPDVDKNQQTSTSSNLSSQSSDQGCNNKRAEMRNMHHLENTLGSSFSCASRSMSMCLPNLEVPTTNYYSHLEEHHSVPLSVDLGGGCVLQHSQISQIPDFCDRLAGPDMSATVFSHHEDSFYKNTSATSYLNSIHFPSHLFDILKSNGPWDSPAAEISATHGSPA